MEAWRLVEIAAIKSDLSTDTAIKRTNSKLILDNLLNTGRLRPNNIAVIKNLRQLRNKVSHLKDFVISQEEAERYVDLAIQSAHAIKNIAS